jgi:hypothetical protein
MNRPLTPQEIFDKGARHLLTQFAKSKRGRICVYRGPDGLMCAAGPFIPDDKYDHAFEGVGVPMPGSHAKDLVDAFAAGGVQGAACLDLLSGLQHVHDNCEPEKWAAALRHLARVRGLNSDVVSTWS